MRVVYLHGFASSPGSRKARLFIEKLGAAGVSVEALDLTDFRHLTITGQLETVDRAVEGEPVTLIGSSMGGYLAALYAASHAEVERLVLLAPAFDFFHLWSNELGPRKLEEWRKNGSISVFHYGMGKHAPLEYHLMEDAKGYPPFPDFGQPCLILHGLEDAVVPFEKSAEFAATHPNVTLVALDTGHEMTDVLDEIWKSASTFLLGDGSKVL